MTKINLRYTLPNDKWYILTELPYYVFTDYIKVTEYKSNKNIMIPWTSITYIDESYEENK